MQLMINIISCIFIYEKVDSLRVVSIAAAFFEKERECILFCIFSISEHNNIMLMIIITVTVNIYVIHDTEQENI